MTPKEKAERLIQRFIYRRTDYVEIDDAKQCALIAVDEIMKALDGRVYQIEFHYWQQVKTEIELL
jgi:hypothetical protein